MNATAIQTTGLSKRFRKTEAVRGIDLTVEQGRVYALLGRNGAGKSTVIRMLLGLLAPDAGSSSVLGLESMRQSLRIKQRVGYVPEGPQLFRWMTLKDFFWFVSGFYPTWDNGYAHKLLEGFNLDSSKKIRSLSKGMVAKVALTAALAHNPELLILDDPTLGLDVIVRREFLESIVSVIQEQGRTVFISTHQIDEVERVADHVGILDEGRLVWQSSLEALKESVKRVRLVVENGFTGPEGVDGILSGDKSERLWSGVISGASDEKLSRLRSLGGVRELQVEHLPLEDIFCALVGGAP